MLQITLPAKEVYDEEKEEFFTIKEQFLQLEHSLVSLSKWESKWRKPFLSDKEKTFEEITDYVRCMTITQNVDPETYNYIDQGDINKVNKYIEDPMTATTFSNLEKKKSREVITAEIIYYWMVTFNIPMECQKWHLNRLLTLINVCNIKNTPSKKMTKKELAHYNHSLNSARRSTLSTRG